MDYDFYRAYGALRNIFTRQTVGFYGQVSKSEEKMRLSLIESNFQIDTSTSIEENILHKALAKSGIPMSKLREDAQIFLLVNIKYMFVLPIKRTYFIYKSRSASSLSRDINYIIDDVTEILSTAYLRSQSKQISSGTILNAASQKWDHLRTNEEGSFWGGRDD